MFPSVTSPRRPWTSVLLRFALLGALVASVLHQIWSVPLWLGGLIGAALTLAIVLLPSALGCGSAARERRALQGLRWADLDRASGPEFERWVVRAVRAAGFHVVPTRATGDFGVDLVAIGRGVRIAVEVKRRDRVLGNLVVRSLVAGATFYRCDAAAVVTQAEFSEPARRQAAGAPLPLLLLGRAELPRLGEHLWELCP